MGDLTNSTEFLARSKFQIRALYASIISLLLAALVALYMFWGSGAQTIDLLSFSVRGFVFSIGLRFDTVSLLMFIMVTTLGSSIAHYSLRYLSGEKRQPYFYRHLLFTLVAVSIFILSSNLLMLFFSWLATSYGLHKLLNFFNERPQAVLAARKKFIISRIGDVFLSIAIIITFWEFGTLELSEIFEIATSADYGSNTSDKMGFIALFFALGAMTKSVQFPFHFWLPETMEAPTPVSALMHAGIINAGGFLMIRLSPIFQEATAAHLLLMVMGALSAVFGALSMITQNDIKKKLAYSTISQMGMMMFACGLGAYSMALFHIIAHSFYKAHAFLGTGTLVEESKKIGFKLKSTSNFSLGMASLIGLILVTVGAVYKDGSYSGYYTYGAIILLGLFQSINALSSEPYSKSKVLLRIISGLSFAIVAALVIETALKQQLTGLIPEGISGWHAAQDDIEWLFIAYSIFAMGFWLSGRLNNPRSPLMKRLYFYFWNGGYFSALTSRILSDGSMEKTEFLESKVITQIERKA